MAEIGRISGPLLKSDLRRDTVDLAIEKNLIKFKVGTHYADTQNPLTGSNPTTWTGRIGIHNDNPQYQLDVVGTIASNILFVKPISAYSDAYAEIDDVRIRNNRIQSLVGDLELAGATSSDKVKILSNTLINANLEVTGNITLGGSINIGDANTDNVVISADIASNIIPDTDKTYDLGSSAKNWRDIYATNINLTDNLNLEQISIHGNKIFTTQSNANLEIDTAGTGSIELQSNTNVTGNLAITGDVTIGGNLTLGDTTFDSITVIADFTSDLVPNSSLTYNLGSAAKSWNNLYVENINVTGNMFFDQISIVGNRISTTQSNADLEFDTAGTGRYVFIGTGGVILPVGNTAERPTPPAVGMIRFNTDDQRVENYNGEEWNRMIHDDDAIAFAIALG